MLNLEKIKNVPKLICSDRNQNWSLLEWLNGKKIEKPNKNNWEKYSNFIISLQDLRNSQHIDKIKYASEACFELNEHYELICSRLNKVFKLTNRENIFININNWLQNVVLKRLNYLKNQIYNNEFSEMPIKKKIISPSDVGFHNILKYKNDLYFFDFEYAG